MSKELFDCVSKIIFLIALIQFLPITQSDASHCSYLFLYNDTQTDEIANHQAATQLRGNNESYIQGMNLATPGKLQLIQQHIELWYMDGFLKPGDQILDIGSGTGLLSIQLSEQYPDLKITGIDIDPEMIALSKKILSSYRMQTDESPIDNLLFQVHLGGNDYAEPNSLSTVIWSSVLHEIYSFSDNNSEAVIDSFQNAYDGLEPGGRVIIRDFAAPENGDRLVLLRQSHSDPTDLSIENYKALVEGTKRDFNYKKVEIGDSEYEEGSDTFILSLKAAYNYMYRKDFKDNHKAESYEDYAWASVSEVETMLSDVGFVNIKSETIVNQWIESNRIEPFIEVFEYNEEEGRAERPVNMHYQLLITATK